MNEADVEDFLAILEEHRKNCETEGKYVEAEIAKNRLEELRMHEFNRRRETLRSQQIAERLGLEEAHLLEFNQFNRKWDESLDKHQEESLQQINTLKEKHQNERNDLQAFFISKQENPNNPSEKKYFKPSKDLLNFRKVQHSLAKQKDYQHAARMKHRADEMEKQERQKLIAKNNRDMEIRLFHLRKNQRKDLQALKKRIKAIRDTIEKKRVEALDQMLLRYNNVQTQLLSNQRIQKTKLYKYRSLN